MRKQGMKKLIPLFLLFSACGRGHDYPKPFEARDKQQASANLDAKVSGDQLKVMGGGQTLALIDGAELLQKSSSFVIYKQDGVTRLLGSTGESLYDCFYCTIEISSQFALIHQTQMDLKKATAFDSHGQLIFDIEGKNQFDAKISDYYAFYSTDVESSLFAANQGEVFVADVPSTVTFENNMAKVTDPNHRVHEFQN